MEAAPPPPGQQPPPPPPLASQPRRVDVGNTISRVFETYGANAGVLLGTAAVVFVFTGIISALLYSTESIALILVSLAVDVVAITLYTGMVVKLVEDLRDGRRDSTINELIESAMPAIVPLILNGLMKGLAVAVGLILLIVPGLILLTIWAVTAPAIVVERAGAFNAFGRSWQLVKGDGWNVFGVIAIAYLITFAISFAFSAIGFGIGDAGGYVLRIAASILTAPIGALVGAILFFELRGDVTAPPGGAATVAGQPPPPAPTPPQ